VRQESYVANTNLHIHLAKMPPTRKRTRNTSDGLALDHRPCKKACHTQFPATTPNEIKHTVLVQYFAKVLTLRDYILQKLPAASRIRKKKLASIGLGSPSGANSSRIEIEQILGSLLDTTLVGVNEQRLHASDTRWEKWTNFSQRGDESHVTLSDDLAGAAHDQSEVCLWVISCMQAED
jgi:telomerase reverse transcriptase